MCGIAGIYRPNGLADNDVVAVAKSIRMMHSRGPDDQGTSASAACVLGHARLSIIDVEGGHQPFRSSSDRYELVYNGEIYNYSELRKALAHKHGMTFRTKSDTEVLLNGLIAEGVPFLRRVNGMFAFGLLDTHQQTLLLGRDRFGKKPLFYSSNGGVLSFASELRALPLGPPRDIDDVAIGLYFLYGYVPAPRTIYPGVHQLCNGEVLQVRASLQRIELAVEKWIATDGVDEYTECKGGSESSVRESVHENLDRAVAMRLTASDVEVGCLLSGGVDSSVVAAIATEHTKKLLTFSASFPSRAFDETRYAVAVAEHIGSRHRSLTVTAEDVPRLARKLVLAHGQPFADSSMLPMYAVSQCAAEYVKVALSGDGADELFGGYGRYVRLDKVDRLEHLLKIPVGSIAARLLAFRLGPQQKLALASKGWQRHAAMSQFISRPVLDHLALHWWTDVSGHVAVAEQELFQCDNLPWRDNYLDSAQVCDANHTYLTNDILAKVDRSAMAVSLEVRCPFLDPGVVTAARSLPSEFRVRGGVGKVLLKDLARTLVPPEVVDRPKMGFSIPLGDWIGGPLKTEFEAALMRNGSVISQYLDTAVLQRCLSGPRLSELDAMMLWTAWMVSCWEETLE